MDNYGFSERQLANAGRVCEEWRNAIIEGRANVACTLRLLRDGWESTDIVTVSPYSIARAMNRGYEVAGITAQTEGQPANLVMVK